MSHFSFGSLSFEAKDQITMALVFEISYLSMSACRYYRKHFSRFFVTMNVEFQIAFYSP